MKPDIDWIEKRQALRTDAARMLSHLSPAETAAQPEAVMLHELLVHKVELEMQIEELRRAHAEMEAARDHYAEFYERAPIGYISLDRECLIDEINLTGAELLGAERGKLAHRRFSMFVAPRDRDRWDAEFVGLMKDFPFEKRTLVLEMVRADNAALRAYLDCRRPRSADGVPRLRLSLFDIGKIEQAKSETDTPPPDLGPKNLGA